MVCSVTAPEIVPTFAVCCGSHRRHAGARDTAMYYACTYCRMHTPGHLCIITPDMPGQCGRYTWDDIRGSVSRETSVVQRPVSIGQVLSMRRGEWTGLNAFVRSETQGAIRRLCLHSLVDAPPPVSPCCECIAAVFPEVNGVIVVNREYGGMTPIGMTFVQMLAYARGRQTPGFTGLSRRTLLADSFLRAEGGRSRVVWMPRELRHRVECMRMYSPAAAEVSGTWFRTADEHIGTTVDAIGAYVRAVVHPAGAMRPIV